MATVILSDESFGFANVLEEDAGESLSFSIC